MPSLLGRKSKELWPFFAGGKEGEEFGLFVGERDSEELWPLCWGARIRSYGPSLLGEGRGRSLASLSGRGIARSDGLFAGEKE